MLGNPLDLLRSGTTLPTRSQTASGVFSRSVCIKWSLATKMDSLAPDRKRIADPAR